MPAGSDNFYCEFGCVEIERQFAWKFASGVGSFAPQPDLQLWLALSLLFGKFDFTDRFPPYRDNDCHEYRPDEEAEEPHRLYAADKAEERWQERQLDWTAHELRP
jgi:hypothetical protein